MDSGGSTEIFTTKKRDNFFKKISLKTRIILIIIILLLLGVGGYVFFTRNSGDAVVVEETENQVSEPTPSQSLSEEVIEEEAAEVPLGGANYQSENFRVGEVAIGGEAEFLLTEDTPGPLEISSVRGEAFTEKNKPEVKLVVSWKTNKLAKSEISYSKGVGQSGKVMAEEDYSLSHSLIIPGLDQAATYVYSIKSTDRFGNEISSDSYAIYTGSRVVSLFDIIAEAIGEVFGWAVKKN